MATQSQKITAAQRFLASKNLNLNAINLDPDWRNIYYLVKSVFTANLSKPEVAEWVIAQESDPNALFYVPPSDDLPPAAMANYNGGFSPTNQNMPITSADPDVLSLEAIIVAYFANNPNLSLRFKNIKEFKAYALEYRAKVNENIQAALNAQMQYSKQSNQDLDNSDYYSPSKLY